MNPDPKLELPEKILQLTKKQPTNESMLMLRKYNEEIKENLRSKEECLTDINAELDKKDMMLKSAQSLIESKDEESQNIKLLEEQDNEAEKEWAERMKRNKRNKINLMQEYLERMAEFRRQLFSSTGFDDGKVNAIIAETEDRKNFVDSHSENASRSLAEIQKEMFENENLESRFNVIKILTQHRIRELTNENIQERENTLQHLNDEINHYQSKMKN